jgi:Fe-S-cluster-containing hydrogenase component 2
MKGPGYKFSTPIVGRALKGYVNSWFRKEKGTRNPRRGEGHPGQVVTLEDAKKVLEIASPVLKVNCACRLMSRGIQDPCCLTFGALAEMVPKLPRFIPEHGAEWLHVDDAQDFVETMNVSGRVNTVWFGPIPYIAALCSCERPECAAARIRMEYGLKFLYKGEYTAQVNFEKCNGCAVCNSRCQFGALTFNSLMNAPYVDAKRCFGCSLCATACPENAIQMVDRNENPVLKDVW